MIGLVLLCGEARAEATVPVTAPPEILSPAPKVIFLDPAAAADGFEGMITAQFDVGTDGAPSNIKIIGDFQVDRFKNRAAEAIAQLRYKPATVDGKPVKWLNMSQTLEYELTDVLSGSQHFATFAFTVDDMIARDRLDRASAMLKEQMLPIVAQVSHYSIYMRDAAMIAYKKGELDRALCTLRLLTHHFGAAGRRLYLRLRDRLDSSRQKTDDVLRRTR